MKNTFYTAIVGIVLIAAAACGGGDSETRTQTSAQPASGALSAHEMENGIGPIDEVKLGAIDAEMAARGKELFQVKCSACHKVEERYIGPALADVTTRRSPAYIMNMVLNPEEMIQRHPEAKALFAQFMTPMANQHLTEDEARAVLEYLRTQAPE